MESLSHIHPALPALFAAITDAAFIPPATNSGPTPPPTLPPGQERSAPPIIFCNELHPLPLPPAILQTLPPFDLVDIPIVRPPPSQKLPSLPSPFDMLGPLSAALQTVARYHFERDPHAKSLEGRMALFYGTPCPKWHTDSLRMRGIATLAGPGSLVFEQGDGCNGKVRECKAGDVLLMTGAGRMGQRDGLLHRSPAWDGARIVVQTDDVEDDAWF
eukprot:GFKZ01013970.1.p1 GENE.GFKZ01013970.1~~GFKZ01013970.1.p1  ORF type:complete len:216 (+),score=17.49 GFKZ01013970.1:223-870(+)